MMTKLQTFSDILNNLFLEASSMFSIISKTLGITKPIPETIDGTIIIGVSIICGLTAMFIWKSLRSKDKDRKHKINLMAYIVGWSSSGLPIIAVTDTRDKTGKFLHKIFLENIPEYTYPYPLELISSIINNLYNQACYILNWDEKDWRNDGFFSIEICEIQISLSYVPDTAKGAHGIWVPVSTYGTTTILNNPNYKVLCGGKPYILESHSLHDMVLDYIFVPLNPLSMLEYLNHHARRQV